MYATKKERKKFITNPKISAVKNFLHGCKAAKNAERLWVSVQCLDVVLFKVNDFVVEQELQCYNEQSLKWGFSKQAAAESCWQDLL